MNYTLAFPPYSYCLVHYLIMVIVSLFKGVDCICVYAMPKSFDRGKQRLAGFAVYFYTIDRIVYVLCIFMKEKRFVQYLLVKKKIQQSIQLSPKRITHTVMVSFSIYPVHFHWQFALVR